MGIGGLFVHTHTRGNLCALTSYYRKAPCEFINQRANFESVTTKTGTANLPLTVQTTIATLITLLMKTFFNN